MRLRDAIMLILLMLALGSLGWVAAANHFSEFDRGVQVLEIGDGCLIYRESGKYKIPTMVFVSDCRVQKSRGYLTVVAR